MLATITINIDPILFHLGPLAVRWYGVIMAIAVLVGAFVFARQLRRCAASTPDHVYGMLLLAVPFGIVGARLFHILDNFRFYWHHPGELWTLQLVGLAIYGVLTGRRARCVHLLPLEEAARAARARLPRPGHPGRAAHRQVRQHHQRRHLGLGHRPALGLRLPATPTPSCRRDLLGVPTQPDAGLRAALAPGRDRHPALRHAAPQDRRHGLPALPRPVLRWDASSSPSSASTSSSSSGCAKRSSWRSAWSSPSSRSATGCDGGRAQRAEGSLRSERRRRDMRGSAQLRPADAGQRSLEGYCDVPGPTRTLRGTDTPVVGV